MLSEEQHMLFLTAKDTQLRRNDAVHIIMSEAAPSVLYGAFIRVLLELQDHREDYIVARVESVATGELYGGFSTNANIKTDKYLVLQLPPFLAQINGTQYQLNSISNSTMTEMEFSRWLEMAMPNNYVAATLYGAENGGVPAGLPIPTRQELLAVARRLRSTVGAGATRHGGGNRSRRGSQVQTSQPSVACATPQSNNAGMTRAVSAQPGRMTHMTDMSISNSLYGGEFPSDPAHNNNNNNNNSNNISGSGDQFARQGTRIALNVNRNSASNALIAGGNGNSRPPLFSGTVSPRPVSAGFSGSVDLTAAEREFDLPTRRQIRQDIINKMNQTNVIFPTNINELKVSQLRLTERDMIEYLEHVREAISDKQENCVVCMDHVPTVISLPCRHKVLCRLCAPSVNTCPVCRSQLFELFEPKEI